MGKILIARFFYFFLTKHLTFAFLHFIISPEENLRTRRKPMQKYVLIPYQMPSFLRICLGMAFLLTSMFMVL